MFKKILIANRGEIACRIIRTARRLGVLTVAVYSDADINALHVKLADEAVHIGPAPANESYLRIDNIMAAAELTGAQAIHPGYGFLSENTQLAQACEDKAIVFVGPPVAAILAMGSKSAAKKIMGDAGVPLVPGYHGENQDKSYLKKQADQMGYPVLIKASAGGGGKGMRVVEKAKDFVDALDSAKREALSSFADDLVLIEKYLIKPRHVEVQVFADNHGNVVHLFDRDCSLQRRHQKVIEEAPAPGLPDKLRAAMSAAAVAAAEAIDYRGAGTVEFILADSGEFYFMEMNTRLQVEHPVTEYITGVDLVEWQLRIASNETLPLQQGEIQQHGHAFEARIYAEDPDKDFLPATGRLELLNFPEQNEYIRVDTGVSQGDQVSVYYDPMLAKIISWGENRTLALNRLVQALTATQVAGMTSNRGFLLNTAQHQEFQQGLVDTGFIGRNLTDLIAKTSMGDQVYAVAVAYFLLKQNANSEQLALQDVEPGSPWHKTDGWRLNEQSSHTFEFADGDDKISVTAYQEEAGYVFELPNGQQQVVGKLLNQHSLRLHYSGHTFDAAVYQSANLLYIFLAGQQYILTVYKESLGDDSVAQVAGDIVAPMPGKLISLLVKAGDTVEQGQTLIVLEAMKMEHNLVAPQAGKVSEVFCAVNELVDDGVKLISIGTN